MARSPFLSALLHPANLAMLALAIAAGLCSAWWLAPVGIVFWLVMVVVIARDPGLQMTFTRQNRQPLAQRFQNTFNQLERARFSCFNAVSRAGNPATQRALQPVQDALDALVDQTYQISLRLTSLDNNLTIQKLTGNFDDQIAKMQKQLAGATDDGSRKEFAATLQSLQSRQAQLRTVTDLLSRFDAQLTGTGSTVDSVVTGVVSMQGTDPKQAAARAQSLLAVLQKESAESKEFEATLDKTPLI